VLYSSLVLEDASEVAAVLERSSIKYRLSEANGTIMVPSEDVQQARMMLASEGLPKGAGGGYELLEKGSSFGVSQFMENIRYQRALEGELSRTISSINSVRSARVHLAIPKNSAFLRKKNKSTASVTIDLFPGRNIDDGQVGAISHLVAASIPGLEAEDVTVIDQKGRLLSNTFDSGDMKATSTQLLYRKNLENYYISRIENILIPLLGEGSVRAQVSADIDFTITEQTQESFNPEIPAIRSEQLINERTHGVSMGGIPGSLSNQPERTVVINDANSEPSIENGQSSSKTVRNYEIDKTISHIRYGGNAIRRLSVAVVVDNESLINDAGEVETKPVSEEKMAKIIEVVKNAVGLDIARGDTINVINSGFFVANEEDVVVEKSIIDNPNIIVIGKYIGAGIVIILLVFGFLKPIMKELASSSGRSMLGSAYGGREMSGDNETFPINSQEQIKNNHQSNLTQAQAISTGDPKRVAQVVNNWVSSDG
jgi:flagellar M-ring protein FliF